MTNKPTLVQIASKIRSFEKRSIETGRLLTVAKDQCVHGEYQDWLAKEFGWTQRTATRIRNLYDFVQNGHKVYFGKKIDIKRLNISLTALYLVASISNADAIKAVLSAAAKGRVSVARASEIILPNTIGRQPMIKIQSDRTHRSRLRSNLRSTKKMVMTMINRQPHHCHSTQMMRSGARSMS